MGKGFGRGAKAVGIVTHAQVRAKKKMPRGLKVSRKKRRTQYRDQDAADAAVASGAEAPTKKGPSNSNEGGFDPKKSLASQIAAIKMPDAVNGRKKGFKDIRKKLLAAVKDVRKRYHDKARARSRKESEVLAAKHRQGQRDVAEGRRPRQ
jgi:hypothetical protein